MLQVVKKVMRGFFWMSLLALSACMNQVGGSGQGTNVATTAGSDLTGSALSFSEHVHPLLATHCANCHGTFQAPFIAYTEDISLSHDNVLNGNHVNFQNIPSSKIISQLRVGHNCWSTNCDSDADIMTAAVERWAADRGEQVSPSGLTTDAQAVPSGASSGFVTLTFDLTRANPDLPAGSTLTLQIRQFDNFSYQVRNPRVIASQAMVVANMTLLVNGVDVAIGGTYSLLNLTAPITASPGFLLSASSVLIAIDGGIGADDIQVQFQTLE